jgi:hypothetical protein
MFEQPRKFHRATSNGLPHTWSIFIENLIDENRLFKAIVERDILLIGRAWMATGMRRCRGVGHREIPDLATQYFIGKWLGLDLAVMIKIHTVSQSLSRWKVKSHNIRTRQSLMNTRVY